MDATPCPPVALSARTPRQIGRQVLPSLRNYPRIGAVRPALAVLRELQRPMPGGKMIALARKMQRDPFSIVARHGKPHRIGHAVLRQPRTPAGIAHVAAVLQFLRRGTRAFETRRLANPRESVAQRKPRTMRPQLQLATLLRNEIRTRHARSDDLLLNSIFYPASCPEIDGNPGHLPHSAESLRRIRRKGISQKYNPARGGTMAPLSSSKVKIHLRPQPHALMAKGDSHG